jgi:excisionase family DNA binding protein
MTELLTTSEAAAALRCNASTVRYMLRAGKLAGVRVGASEAGDWRIPRASLDAFLGVTRAPARTVERSEDV